MIFNTAFGRAAMTSIQSGSHCQWLSSAFTLAVASCSGDPPRDRVYYFAGRVERRLDSGDTHQPFPASLRLHLIFHRVSLSVRNCGAFRHRP